jgi:N utilization substance protein B
MKAFEQDTLSSMGESNDASIPAGLLSPSDTRSLTFHLLYAMESFDYSVSLEAIADNFSKGFCYTITPQDQAFIQAKQIIDQREQLDTAYLDLLENWRSERIGVCTRLILRLAMWELQQKAIEPAIIINEAIELSKCFAEQDAYKFVNGILDEWLKKQQAS